ncbi:MAG TPA: alpha/beta fold hydrolase [Acidimicrobiales bacterium]|nr:alpha/beta fold hydrolase [Acidimicrobiales bacterium]
MSGEARGRHEPDRAVDTDQSGAAGELVWEAADILGHRVRYGVTGVGPPALFLHGWGLRPHAYRRPIEAMARAGCRVFAPALPGFGGTGELPAEQRTFAGYGAWVGKFLDAVGVDGVALVAGHSFGGGVAAAFVYEQPWRASALLLANAVGSPTWALFPDEVRTMVQRPAWDWGRHFSTDLLGSPGRLRLLPTLLEDFIPNLLGNPLGMFRTGEFIRRADLVREVGSIARWGIPVTVVWSDRDRLVPRSAFDDFRHAAGVDGVVVDGSHAWLIADPTRFGELAISALVDSGALTPRSVAGSA